MTTQLKAQITQNKIHAKIYAVWRVTYFVELLTDLVLIPAAARYEGMIVYVAENTNSYQLKGGIADEDWALLIGTGAAGWGDISGDIQSQIDLMNKFAEYQKNWNATTNTPELSDGTGTEGERYLCNVGGTVNLGSGNITFAPGDWVIYDTGVWKRVVVVLNADQISSAGTTNKFITAAELTKLAGIETGAQVNTVTLSNVVTLTGKDIKRRITTEVSSATPTINTNNCDIHIISGLATNITSMTANLTGSPTPNQFLMITYIPVGGPFTISHGSGFESSSIDLFTEITARTDAVYARNDDTDKRRLLDYK